MKGANMTPQILAPEDGARLGILEVAPYFMVGLGQEGTHVLRVDEDALSPDTEIVSIGVGNGNFRLILKSSRFGALRKGQTIPILPSPKLRR